ncbi:MAG TPA: BadF/BadG/BcrA/BcrD ATPase family protein [Bryobacteraceae bacterium]|nr:BadF/BadG/BcrA/BcrD ATPase family protein [Bryobacteraceae bacterium]
MTKLYLGVDGGQSGTIALIGDEDGQVVGMGRAGPCTSLENVANAIFQAKPQPSVFQSACFGLSGGAAEKESLIRELAKAEHYLITHDAWVALAGATAGEPGIAVIAGTGSIAFGRNRAGRTARAGGWGYVFGDEGGAFDIARQALRAALRQEEGWGPSAALREILLDATGAPNANDLLHRCHSGDFPRNRFAALAPLISQAAAAGDPVAHDILKSAAQSLATLAAAVRAQLFGPSEPVLVSYCGGVFGSPELRERFRMLVELTEFNRAAPPRYSPAAGALLEAYRIAGVARQLTNIPEDI